MERQESKHAMVRLRGEWPAPPMADEETLVWVAHFRTWRLEEFLAAVDVLVGDSRRFRPNPSEMLTAMAAVRRRDRTGNVLAELANPEPPASRETAFAALAAIRERAGSHAQTGPTERF